MLTEMRHNTILNIVNSKGSVTNAELMDSLNASESTIRRDLSVLESLDKLKKVRGGAVKIGYTQRLTSDDDISARSQLNVEEKSRIAKYAVSLIEEKDFVFIDAGTTTLHMIDYIENSDVTYITNGVEHAKKLAEKNVDVHLVGGEYKAITDATVGEETVCNLDKYNFTKGFFGSNGFTLKNGHTTPEFKEALVKKKAIEKCKDVYVLMDDSKFGVISSVTFDYGEESTIITNLCVDEKYKKKTNVVEV